MSSFQRIGIVTLLVLLSGCANQIHITSDYDHTARFDAWKTYAWAPGTQTGLSDPRLNAAYIDPQVRANVNRELAAKGYVQQTVATADFLVSYYVSIEDKTGKEYVSGPIYSAYAMTYQDGEMNSAAVRNPNAVSYPNIYRAGTVLLRITNPQTKTSAWHGIAQARLADNSSLTQKQQRLKNAIHLILDNFPPK